ncbi:MAG: DUF3859 domain-containing protein [Candidatus Thiodiazotropha sp. (ex Lucinoma annulata)]|nr:DUF3859 domain-containing protein [Candidatus Thiodiazotropha sp. (ex Lucinoma borealis)]MCU7840159.1 DUF3859 domain-containing protein [Candidatus Thiodiazotropha sp. (ex Troendleina suluensis)]MCU7867974.1 DUF3859 domain-containing protein [Candidatus Thiodiazotropha sp. (ex Lucinoma borealis)]MCU7884824.1 DUF3859 domain-containing protein [Candidatus Thiodiazotropha sp. (ex Lucinoma annulata)]MCU7947011.1 DUF3859 domain-containing protein [Candidatus Thiodiazotropha sp. (ex Cardiolucina c
MKISFSQLPILVLLIVGCAEASDHRSTNAKAPSGQILQYGIYTLLRGGEIISDPKTTTGKGVSKPIITRDRETDRIPLIKDKYMAYQYRLSNIPGSRSVRLRRVLRHPEFKLPDGTTSSGSDFTITKRVERGEVFAYDAYALNEAYEMVEGEWTFQIWFDDRLLVEQKFTTYWP